MALPSTKIVRNPRPLPPDGSFQGARLPTALRPDYVEVDGYTTADWVAYVLRLAERVNFVNPANEITDDWSTFYRRQPGVAIGRLLSWKLERLALLLDDHRKAIENVSTPVATAADTFPRWLDSMFSLLASATVNLEAMVTALPAEHPLRERATAMIRAQLAPALSRWVAYYRAALAAPSPLVNPTYLPAQLELRERLPAGGHLISMDELLTQAGLLSPAWSADGKQPWTEYAATVMADATIYGTESGDVRRAIVHAAGHQFFHGVYELFLSSALHLRAAAQTTWQAMLAGGGDHQPHLTLLLAFLRARDAQKAMLNGLTDRHLNFYYEKVLRLRPARATPPSAYLTAELRKHHPAIVLPAGTAFRGGKDPDTKLERLFRSNSPATILPAKITDLRALYKVDDDTERLNNPDFERASFHADDGGRYYSATVANSADGMGEELPEGTTAWHPFGYRYGKGRAGLRAGMTPARMGLLIASPWLLLREGTRTVTLSFGESNFDGLRESLQISLSTKDGWHELTVEFDEGVITFTLDPGTPAILPYDEEVHQLVLKTPYPVLKIELPADAAAGAYTRLRTATFTKINLEVDVKELRQLTLSGSGGSLDPSGPFYPFGATPRGGEVLYVGHPELAAKAVTPTINWTWNAELPPEDAPKETEGTTEQNLKRAFGKAIDAPEQQSATEVTVKDLKVYGMSAQAMLQLYQTIYGLGLQRPRISFSRLSNGAWGSELSEKYGAGAKILSKTSAGDFSATPATAYRHSAKNGFVRMRLLGDWGHASYPATLAAGLAKTPVEVPDLPFNPELGELTLDYTGAVDLPLDGSTVFSLTPFGHTVAENRLLPTLITKAETEDAGEDAGALLVGIQGWDPATNLSLLLQVEDGSADNLLDKPDDHLQWHFLNENQWVPFPPDKVSDGTRGLLQTGIVTLGLPFGVRTTNTRMGGEDKTWIRMSAVKNVDTVSYLEGIHLNAFAVTQDDDPALKETFVNLPAGSIAKLLQPVAGVKKIAQPYAAFGGTAREARDAYFTRYAERLRHKDRAVTEWDVEHLVLEAFPEVDRVICLQHYRFEPATTKQPLIIDELAPGHLTVLPIGRSGGTRANPLRPYVSLATRKAIGKFLADRLSSHATLHLHNPLFDEITVSLRVRFRDGTDETWADAELRREIVDFISPWHDGGLEDLNFAAAVHPALIVNHLEELPFVDYIKDLGLQVDRKGRPTAEATSNPPIFKDAVTTDLRVALLVAAAANSHQIEKIETSTEPVEVVESSGPVDRRRPGRTLIQFTPKPASDGDND